MLILCFRYHGLPPSWVASLAGVGYSEEEIETINHRRATSRAPSTVPFQHPNFPNLPSTSQLSTATQNTRGRATPSSSIRTPSIHRQPSQASVQSRGTRRTREVSTDTARSRQSFYQTSSGSNSFGDLSYAADDNLPPLPNNPSTHFNDTTHKPKKSIDTLTSGFMNLNGQIPSPITRSKSSHDLPLVPSQPQSQLASRPSQSRTPSRDGVSQVGKIAGPTGPSAYHPPRTPPKSVNQTFRVVNEPFLQSPPPAYHLDGPPPISTVEKPPLSSSQPQQLRQRAPQPQLRKMPSTRQRQVDEEPRISVLSTSTITPRSGSEDHSTDQRDASEPEVNSACFDNGETDGVGFSPISLPPLELSMSSLPMPPPVPAKKKRYSLAPPRLSLGEDTFVNIGSWGDSLFDSLSATPTTAADSSLDASPSNGLIKKSAAVTGGTGVEKRKLEASLSAGATGSNFTSTSLAIKEKEKEKDKKESSGPHGLTTPSSLLVSPPLATSLSLPNQTIHQRSQSSLSQCQVQSQSQVQSQAQTQSQLQLAPTPPPKTAPVIPIPQPPALSTSTSSSSSTSTSGSDSQPKTRMLPSTTTTRVPDRFTPSPASSLARGRTEYDPPKSGDSPLPKTTTSTNLPPIPQPQPPWERPSSRASAVHRPLPPQKPLPTLSLMSPIPLPNPPSHVELKSKISTVSLKTAAKREREKEAEKVEKVESFEKQEQEALKKVENAKAKEEAKERWPMTATETIEFMASINHDNDGLDFGKKKGQDTSALPDLNKKMSSVSLDTCQSYDVRDSHLSVDSTKFDPDRLSSTSTGSRGSTRSSSGLKLIIEGGDYHNDNRDSNISTSTITNATIVSGPVEVATRARADLVTSPATPNPQVGLGLSGSTSSPSPANLGALSPGEPPLEAGAGSRETTPKQTTPSVSNVDVVTDDESSRVGLEGRSSSPGSSTHSHSSSSATTLSSTGLSSLGSANKTVGFTRPVIKQGSGWESEEGVGKVVVSNSSSSLASPYKSEFDDESGGGGGDDGDGDDDGDEIEVGDEEEDAVITRISPPSPGSQEGFAAGFMDEITDHRRPSLDMPSLSSYSSVAPGPHTAAAAVSQMPSPFNSVPHSAGSGGSPPVQSPSWVSDALSEAGLETFVDEKVEPRDYFEELTEVAEGESGFVYRARVVQTVPGSKLTERGPQPGTLVAIKAIPILSSGSSKLQDLKREMEVMKRVFEDDRSAASLKFPSVGASHALIMEAMYVDLQEDALWIRMELMERSLADVVALVEEGHLERIDEKVAARFASDVGILQCCFLVRDLIISCPFFYRWPML